MGGRVEYKGGDPTANVEGISLRLHPSERPHAAGRAHEPQFLELTGTQVNDEQLDVLRKALPTCTIYVDESR